MLTHLYVITLQWGRRLLSLLYLSLLFFGGWAVWTEEVFFSKVSGSQLLGLDVSHGLVAGWYPTESLNLHPAHQVLSSKMLVQENLSLQKQANTSPCIIL